MIREELKQMSDKEKIQLLEELKNNSNEINKVEVIRSLFTDELKSSCIHYLSQDDSKSAITYSMTEEENKYKVISSLTDEKAITSATIELSDNIYKIKLLSKITSSNYKDYIIQSLIGNDEEIVKNLDIVENEKDKSMIISNLSNNDVKKTYLKDIKYFNNRSLIVTTIKDEELKHKYINNARNNAIKTLLIASLENRNERNNLLNTNNNSYSNFAIPNKMTIGIEIETEGEGSTESYLVEKIIKGWNSKRDTSLKNGVEIASPILSNDKEDTEDLYCVCKILNDLGQNVSERCAGHIHIGADFLKTKEAYKNLVELWSNNEELIYLISNQKGEFYREGIEEYAKPISKRTEKSISLGNFDDYDTLTREDFIEKIKDLQKGEKDNNERKFGINFLNVGTEDEKINTIEFRVPNGTINANTWVENVNFFGGMMEISQRLSDIENKDYNNRTNEENQILDKFQRLKSKDINEQERLDLLLNLCVPEEIRKAFIERYNENSKLIDDNSKIKHSLDGQIAEKPVIFPIGKNVNNNAKKIAIENNKTLKECNQTLAVLRENYTEIESPRHITEDTINLE